MTNTVYFHNTIRDDESVVSTTSEDEETPFTSNTTEDEETPFTSNRYTHQQGLNPEDDYNDGYSNSNEFSFINELESATRNFHYGVQLDGPFEIGRVFLGWMDENKLTATKPGKRTPVAVAPRGGSVSFEGGSEWEAEVNYLGRLFHPNLLRLIGYCLDNKVEKRLLVYEFMHRGRGSLENHLLQKFSTPLSWSVRMKIALGAAKGLAFLHSAPINVIHRDFKSSNILLDMDYNAKLSGFKLAMDGPTLSPAPEFFDIVHLTAKCDVYAFGVVLLEMLSGRRAIDRNRPSEEHFLVKWAKPYLKHKRKVYRVADSRLEGQYSLKSFQKAANLALICLSRNGKSRPNMDEVAKVLGEL